MHKGRDRLSSALSGMPPLHGYESHFALSSLFVLARLICRGQHTYRHLHPLYLSLRIPNLLGNGQRVIFIYRMAEDYHMAVVRVLFVPFCIVVDTETGCCRFDTLEPLCVVPVDLSLLFLLYSKIKT